MVPSRFDVLVVGAGPAGSVAALTLAAGGARVALLDKARFPRDKACGDLVGPRGLQVLDELGLPRPVGVDVGDMSVVGPGGRAVRLPSAPGLTYPGHGTAVPRTVLDASLRQAAVAAGAVAVHGRAADPLRRGGRIDGFAVDGGRELRADAVIGADGATSRVAAAAGLVDDEHVLWGFAIRSYVRGEVPLPAIVLWERTPWHALPGYGWAFPSDGGTANVGLGVGVGPDRRAGAAAARLLDRFVEHAGALGILGGDRAGGAGTGAAPQRLGGWLKMGMVGTTPAAGPVLLVGDAAGLVNPLQGEGIAPAMASGRAAAQAVLAGPDRAGATYREWLSATQLPYLRIAATAQEALLHRPRLLAGVGRLMTAPALGPALAGGWAVFWNALLDGAPASRARTQAAVATGLGARATARSATARWFTGTLTAPTSATRGTVGPDPVGPVPVGPVPVGPDPVGPDPVGPVPVSPDPPRTTGSGAGTGSGR